MWGGTQYRIAFDQPKAVSMRLQMRICDYSIKLVRNFKGKTVETHPWIDIFALDKVPRFLKDIFYVGARILIKQYSKGDPDRDSDLYEYLSKYRNKQGNNLLFSYTSEYLGKKEKIIYKEEDFSFGKKVQFEDLLLNAPINPEKILSQIYGSYLIPPAEDKRKPKHSNIIVR